MTYSASNQSEPGSEPGFWETEILDLLFPRSQSQPVPSSYDADLVKQFSFIPGLKETLMLRQVHALEHATVWVLSSMTGWRIASPTPSTSMINNSAMADAATDNETLGGMSTDRGFYLYGDVHRDELRRAVQTALRRITSGESDLAVHPRCGTNLSMGMMLTAGLTLGAAALLPRGPIEQLLGVGMAAIAAAHLTPELGNLAQRYITTAVPFNLAIANITALRDPLDRPAHFVEVRWVE